MFYPDNPQRLQRCNDLVNNCDNIQSTIKDAHDSAVKEDTRMVDTLNAVAKARGFASPDDYINDAMKQLPADVKTQMANLRDSLTKHESSVKLAYEITGTIVAVGLLPDVVKLVGPRILRVTTGIWSLVCASRASIDLVAANVASAVNTTDIALVDFAQGASEVAQEAGQTAEEVTQSTLPGLEALGEASVSSNVSEAISGASNAVSEASSAFTAVKALEWGGRALAVVGVLASVGAIIDDAVEGAQARDKLQGLIKEYCARRFAIKRLHLQYLQAATFYGDARTLIHTIATLDMLVAAGSLAADVRQSTIASEYKKIADKYTVEMGTIMVHLNSDAYTALKALDLHSWTNEDPSYEDILNWIKAHKNDP